MLQKIILKNSTHSGASLLGGPLFKLKERAHSKQHTKQSAIRRSRSVLDACAVGRIEMNFNPR